MVVRDGKTMHRIRAQIEKIPDKDLANKLISFLLEEYKTRVNNNSIIDLWRAFMITYDGYINAKYRKLEDIDSILIKFMKQFQKLQEILSFSVSGGSLLMDGYTLGRMLRTYDQKSKKHVPSFKSIVYAGEAHIQTYVTFFEKILRTKMNKYNPNAIDVNNVKDLSKVKRCIDVNLKDFM